MRSFDFVTASLREAVPSLKMTEVVTVSFRAKTSLRVRLTPDFHFVSPCHSLLCAESQKLSTNRDIKSWPCLEVPGVV
jgi:hypothetical protein